MPLDILANVITGVAGGVASGLTSAACSCFPGDATVLMKGGTTKRMRDVKIGDAIWDGQQFTEVFLLSRADDTQSAHYVTVSAGASSMRCTTGHLIPVRADDGMESLKASEQLEVGDEVQVVASQSSGVLEEIWLKLQNVLAELDDSGLMDEDDFGIALEICQAAGRHGIHTLTQKCTTDDGHVDTSAFMQEFKSLSTRTWFGVHSVSAPSHARDGTFNPLTMSGKLAVDGVVCSAYTASNPPERFIPATAPVRAMYTKKGAATVQQWSDSTWDLQTSRPKGWKEAPLPTVDVNSLPPSQRELTSQPAAFTITSTRAIGGKTHYIVDCKLQNGQNWKVAKRYSDFLALRDALSEQEQGLATAFPRKAIGNTASTVGARKTQLAEWANSVLGTAPNAAIREFVSENRVRRIVSV